MHVLTIYCCGTGYNREKVDIVSTLNQATAHDHLILDGPGSGSGIFRSQAVGAFSPGASAKVTGGLFGVGIDANIQYGIDWVTAVLQHRAVTAINMCGWSRGGVTCLKFAHAVRDLVKRPDAGGWRTFPGSIALNIFAIDPVPGSTGFLNWHSWKNVGLAINVRRYSVVYAQHESRRGFAPIMPSTIGGMANITMEVMAGTHSSVAGTEDNLELFRESAELVFDMAKRFLMSCGTEFYGRKLLDSADILERYAIIRQKFGDYQRVGKKGFGLGDYVGSPGRSVQSDKGVQLAVGFTPEKIAGFFVNDHHRDVMMAQYPALVGFLDEFDGTAKASPAPHEYTRTGTSKPKGPSKWKVDESALRSNALSARRPGAANDLRNIRSSAPETAAAARIFLSSHGENL